MTAKTISGVFCFSFDDLVDCLLNCLVDYSFDDLFCSMFEGSDAVRTLTDYFSASAAISFELFFLESAFSLFPITTSGQSQVKSNSTRSVS